MLASKIIEKLQEVIEQRGDHEVIEQRGDHEVVVWVQEVGGGSSGYVPVGDVRITGLSSGSRDGRRVPVKPSGDSVRGDAIIVVEPEDMDCLRLPVW